MRFSFLFSVSLSYIYTLCNYCFRHIHPYVFGSNNNINNQWLIQDFSQRGQTLEKFPQNIWHQKYCIYIITGSLLLLYILIIIEWLCVIVCTYTYITKCVAKLAILHCCIELSCTAWCLMIVSHTTLRHIVLRVKMSNFAYFPSK